MNCCSDYHDSRYTNLNGHQSTTAAISLADVTFALPTRRNSDWRYKLRLFLPSVCEIFIAATRSIEQAAKHLFIEIVKPAAKTVALFA